ncbi:MAG: hypothetical protein RL329_3727 [Bacteroidota bacterium]|jgi:hypothetical protein
MNHLNHFWKQPAQGFDEQTRGRTRPEIAMKEKQFSLEEVVQIIDNQWNVHLEMQTDGGHSWFNFDKYYVGNLKKESFHLYLTLSPNQHRSGTYLHQHRPKINFILTLNVLSEHPFSNQTTFIRQLGTQIASKGLKWSEILIPKQVYLS